MVAPTNHVIAPPGFILRGVPGTLEIFNPFFAEYR